MFAEKLPVGGTRSVDAVPVEICSPDALPDDTTDPAALTALTFAHAAASEGADAEKFAPVVQSVAAPLQYLGVQPAGYLMSEADVSFIFVGSIVCTIS